MFCNNVIASSSSASAPINRSFFISGNTGNYRFWKLIHKSLEWPYNTNCDYYNRNNLYHSRENCIEYCNLYNQNLSQECLNDPSNKTSFSVSDRIMNKTFRHLKVCETPNKFSTLFKCEKLCKRHCYEDYY
jgi:transcriptional antiterminator